MTDNAILQARQERGWSQVQLLHRMRAAARIAGVKLPDDATLRITLSGWEHARHSPSPMYRRLLCQAFDLTEADLGFRAKLGPSDAHVGPETLAYLSSMFDLHAKADQQLGSRVPLQVVLQQTKLAEAWTRQARGPIREPLLHVVSRYAELCGWLHQDQGDFASADAWTRRAIEISQELGDQRLVAYALTRRSNIATESGEPLQGLHLAEAALKHPSDARVIALSLRQKAAAHALLGEPTHCRDAVDRGTEAAERGSDVTHPESDYCTVSYIRMEGAQAMLVAGNATTALEFFNVAMQDWPAGQDRDRGLCLARMANAHAELGDFDAACCDAQLAVRTLQVAASARTASSLRHLRGRLLRHRHRPDVADLRELLAAAV